MPEPIQCRAANSCEYDPAEEVCRAPLEPPAPNPRSEPAAPNSSPAVAQLVSRHPPPALAPCLNEEAALIVASGNLLRSAGAMTLAAPTLLGELPAIMVFVGSAVAVGATAAQYLNCRDAAEPSE